jgi:predicted nucleic acid-binding protein
VTPLFLDPSVVLLAVGGDHPFRDSCREVLAGAAADRLRLHLSVEGGQEFLFHRLRRVGRERALREFDQVERLVVWHPFDLDILRASRDLVSRGHARGRDAVHAATALAAGFSTIVSTDRDLDGIPGLARLDPAIGLPG